MADVKNYAAVTAAYWAFTLTDGALRMLVLLHFHHIGYSPLDLAFLFLLYEAMGILTNFFGGWIGARYGLKRTLFAGLGIQIIALCMLSALSTEWTIAFSVIYVMAAQALSGVAKDLTKMSSKSAIKLVVKDENQGLLFKWVALLTGSKNALKGLGFLLGGILLGGLGFENSLWAMAGMLAVVLIISVAGIKGELGKAKEKIKGKDLFSKTKEINYLSAARIFLFASRDVWFVVGVPVFLYSSFGWNFDQVGGFMAAWVIGYGIVQAYVPKLLRNTKSAGDAARAAKIWGAILASLPLLIAAGMSDKVQSAIGLSFNTNEVAYILVGGLLLFGAVFAVNSSVHSYLIVAYSDHDKVTLNVGFYYMANAIGRLGGTLLSGLVFQYAGLTACLLVSAGLLVTSFVLVAPLSRPSLK
ncbi:organoarsenical effux MFS transporter ArsJ [Sneathiella sp. P13V-1]|uniref:organoarsenical effux MFS transporter ArsJ n=1 Tax=Sneathiella sp. P13V-1 TaxID=2697366 RepID=UPI00187B2212|nr:organoarsenical effux MFS transporter ArsJ [Sneathiella sp. P13V-1]MBE7637749.1 organoarsenical effux MFS transporter ArsJ [Sneathiella sp. P13V-1]